MTRRLWLAAVVVLGALGFLLYQGLGNATLYFRTADEAVAQRETLGDRRFRIEGNVLDPVQEQGEFVSFRIESNGVQVPITHKGDPPELFQPGIPVVLEGRFQGEGFASDRILVKHSETYVAENPERVTTSVPDGRAPAVNAIVGTAAVALALAGSILGVITLALGLKRGDPRFLRAGQRYVWVVLGGAVLATVAMQSALIGHDFAVDYVARNNSRATPLLYTITGMWSALEGSILLWGLVLAGYLAVMARHFRSRASDPLVAWATLVGLVVVAFFFLLLAGPGQPVQGGAGGRRRSTAWAPTPCCRTTPWSRSTRRCSTWATSASPSPSPSPSPPSPPAAWGRGGWSRPAAGPCSPGASSPWA